MAYLIHVRSKLSSPEAIEAFMLKFGTFFSEFNSEGIFSWYFYPLFIIKRLSVLCTIFFISIPIVQLSVSMTFTLAVRFMQIIIYLLVVRPATSTIKLVSIVTGEICVFVFYLVLALQFKLDINFGLQKDSLCIYIMLFSVGMSVVFSVFSAGIGICTWIKERKLKKISPETDPHNLFTEIDGHITRKNP